MMTRHRIELHPQAAMEGRAAGQRRAKRSPLAAAAFLDEIDGAVDAIAQSPERWPLYERAYRRYIMRRFPFSVIYLLLDDRIRIVAIAHARRRSGYWMDRVADQ